MHDALYRGGACVRSKHAQGGGEAADVPVADGDGHGEGGLTFAFLRGMLSFYHIIRHDSHARYGGAAVVAELKSRAIHGGGWDTRDNRLRPRQQNHFPVCVQLTLGGLQMEASLFEPQSSDDEEPVEGALVGHQPQSSGNSSLGWGVSHP